MYGETARYDCEVISESSNIYTFVYVFSSSDAMGDPYKVKMIQEHMAHMEKDEYYAVQLKGSAAKPINLDKGALKLLEEYYAGEQL